MSGDREYEDHLRFAYLDFGMPDSPGQGFVPLIFIPAYKLQIRGDRF